jgi:uncharacterized damage-inducible protein DinB
VDIWASPPLDTRGLFEEERRDLLTLLDSLSASEWLAASSAEGWTVKDLALHLLDGDLGTLSRGKGTIHEERQLCRRDQPSAGRAHTIPRSRGLDRRRYSAQTDERGGFSSPHMLKNAAQRKRLCARARRL